MHKARITTTVSPDVLRQLRRVIEGRRDAAGRPLSVSAAVEEAITRYVQELDETDHERRYGTGRKLEALAEQVQAMERRLGNRLASMTSLNHRSAEAVYELLRQTIPAAHRQDDAAIREAARRRVGELQQRARKEREGE